MPDYIANLEFTFTSLKNLPISWIKIVKHEKDFTLEGS